MFLYSSDQEGLAWLEAGDDSWADRAGWWYENEGGTSRRRDDDDPARAEDAAP